MVNNTIEDYKENFFSSR